MVGGVDKPKKNLKKTRQGAGRGTKKSSVKPYRGQGGKKRRTKRKNSCAKKTRPRKPKNKHKKPQKNTTG